MVVMDGSFLNKCGTSAFPLARNDMYQTITKQNNNINNNKTFCAKKIDTN